VRVSGPATPIEVDNGNGRFTMPKTWAAYRKSPEVLRAAKECPHRELCGKWFIAVHKEREVETHVATRSTRWGNGLGRVTLVYAVERGN